MGAAQVRNGELAGVDRLSGALLLQDLHSA